MTKLLKCKLCRYKAKQLHQHLKAVHKITSREYRQKFGQNEIMQIGFTPSEYKNPFRLESKRISEGYSKQRKRLGELNIYSLDETISKLSTNNTYKLYCGKTKYRTMIKDDARLYASILHHTLILKSRNVKSTLEQKMKFIISGCNINTIRCKCGKTLTMANGCRYCSHNKVREQSEESKLKQSKTIKDYFIRTDSKFRPNYNPTSIKVIESYGELNDYNFQHAENGGEYKVPGLGYFLDAYDKDRNVALEIDEKHHYRNGKLKQRDILRQQKIEEQLGCKFIRIKI